MKKSVEKLVDNYDKPLRGRFRIIDLSEGEEVLHEDNLVVDKARNILRNLMFTADGQYIISHMKFGTKGTVNDDMITPKAPTIGDTKLFENNPSLIYTKQVSKQLQGDLSIVYSVILERDEANLNGGAYPITEAGLFNSRGEMFAHKTFPVIVKNADRVYKVEWTIIF